MYDDVEEASSIRAIRGSHDRGLPMEKILPHWPCTTWTWRISLQIHQLLLYASTCHLITLLLLRSLTPTCFYSPLLAYRTCFLPPFTTCSLFWHPTSSLLINTFAHSFFFNWNKVAYFTRHHFSQPTCSFLRFSLFLSIKMKHIWESVATLRLDEKISFKFEL